MQLLLVKPINAKCKSQILHTSPLTISLSLPSPLHPSPLTSLLLLSPPSPPLPSPVVSHLPTEDTLTEDKAREYFIDLILGLEYCKLTKQATQLPLWFENCLLYLALSGYCPPVTDLHCTQLDLNHKLIKFLYENVALLVV